ncbi:MAG: DUF1569 domain-containing protein [Mucilaginibacter sp.]|uniref:DUF1569 domain-containing protein n=1 Tax=Mucilaginibacter sp. TaxID=1882438 RepID=UPI0034E60EFC
MKTIFDKTTRDELINRINTLNENSTAQWGKMNIYQMLKHCTLWEEMILGKEKYKRAFIGRLFGKMALKNILKDEKPLQRNTPTIPELKISGNGNVSIQKAAWVAKIDEYEHFSNPDFVHPFFGKMTKEQIGYMVYKHTDHHLLQFNS